MSLALLSIVTLTLTGILAYYLRAPIFVVILCLASAVSSGVVITWWVRTIDSKSISSLRRILGLLFVSTAIWLIPVLVGIPFSSFLKNAILNEFVFGGFLAWSFELIVVYGVFLKSIAQSLALSAVHPIPIMLLVLYVSTHPYLSIPFSGVGMLLIVLVFLVLVNRVRTKNGIPSLRVLQAFLKTWVERNPAELETFFSSYAKNDSISTDLIIIWGGDRKTVMVVPGIHPGPFAPVGSYNLSELINKELEGPGSTPVVLHGTGGHERNVPTNELAREYAATISRFVSSQGAGEEMLMRGPLRSKVGITNITTLGFGRRILAFISNSPYRSDDLDPSTVAEASGAAAELDLQITIIDAHNSVDGEEGHQERITKEDWLGILNHTLQLPESGFNVGVASSLEIGFEHGSDVSDGGISVVIFATEKTKCALISADSNNAKSGLRESVATLVNGFGVDLLDLCTSDTHKLAARNRTSRGYFALGEQTSPEAITRCIKTLVGIAEERLVQSELLVARFHSEFPVIGEESLDDFAGLTGRTITITKNYAKVAAPIVLLLLAITLFY